MRISSRLRLKSSEGVLACGRRATMSLTNSTLIRTVLGRVIDKQHEEFPHLMRAIGMRALQIVERGPRRLERALAAQQQRRPISNAAAAKGGAPKMQYQ